MTNTFIAMPQIIAGLRYQATTQTFFNVLEGVISSRKRQK